MQILYNFAYSIILYTIALGCTQVTNNKPFNNVFWFASRGIEDVFWVYPFLIVFWPRKQAYSDEETAKIREFQQEHSHSFIEEPDLTQSDIFEDEVASIYNYGTVGSRHNSE